MNDLGQVTGESRVAALPGADPKSRTALHMFAYANNAVADLGTLGGSGSSAGFGAINNAGLIVGASDLTGDPTDGTGGVATHACAYTDGKLVDLGTLGGTSSWATGVGNGGAIVGASYLAGDSLFHGAIFHVGAAPTDLAPLAGDYSDAVGVNAVGQAVGFTSTTADDDVFDAALFYNGTVTDLGGLGGDSSTAYAINNLGVAVGDAYTADDAALFVGGHAYDLNDLVTPATAAGWTLTNAYGVNDAGQIVGSGIDPAGVSHAFLLTPVPEPTTIGVVVLTAANFAARRRRRT